MIAKRQSKNHPLQRPVAASEVSDKFESVAVHEMNVSDAPSDNNHGESDTAMKTTKSDSKEGKAESLRRS